MIAANIPERRTETAIQCDFVVMGSGSAGLSAALAAANAGLSVLIIEKTEKIGGMSAYSGAGTWIPANHHAIEAGISDSVDDAITYLHATAPEGWAATESALWRSFAENAPKALKLIEGVTPLEFELLDLEDTFPDAPGGKSKGRMLSPRLLRRAVIGKWANKIRTSKLPQIFTYSEMYDLQPMYAGWVRWIGMLPKLILRLIKGKRGLGTALIVGLLKGCLDSGCQIVTNARVRKLLTGADGEVTGVVAEILGREVTYRANCGVVIASGGYEWNTEMLQQHFPGPMDFLASPRANEGDGHRVAAEIGADLAHMDQANLNAAIPGIYEGQVQGIGWFHHRAPNSVIVNQKGERFVNEEHHNLGLILDQRGSDGQPINLPAWLISDADFLTRERLAMSIAKCEPTWLTRASSLESLAAKLGIESDGLIQTVDSFNNAILSGFHDPIGRTSVATIVRRPFVAMPFNRSFMSTKGGPRTDEHARVLRKDGSVIKGLYCAGVAMANPIGTKGVGAGTTIGPNLTWGYIAGTHAASTREAVKSTAA
jgi:3-oxosteroid 1-dehydrogenase